MKKSVVSLFLGASLMVSTSAFALTAMTDSNMKDATGQAGVSIALDDVTLYQSIGSTTYTDTDGWGTATDAAGIQISGAETLTTIRAILDDSDRGGFLTKDYSDIMEGINDYAGLRDGYDAGGTGTAIGVSEVAPLTIDVSSKVMALSYGMAFNKKSAAKAAWGLLSDFGNVSVATMDAEVAKDTLIAKYKAVKNETINDAQAAVALNLAIKLEEDASLVNSTVTDAIDAAIAAVSTAGQDAWDNLSAEEQTAITDQGPTAQATWIGTVQAGADLMAGMAETDTQIDTADTFQIAKDNIAVAGVVIGLPTIEIAKTGSTKTISAVAAGSANDGKDYIAIKTGKSTLAILGGYIEICPH